LERHLTVAGEATMGCCEKHAHITVAYGIGFSAADYFVT
jgi:hypothetical protein